VTTFELVRNTERLQELESPWQALWHDQRGSIFQSYHWINEWWAAAQGSFDLCIVTAWEGNRLQAVMPFAVRRWYGVRLLEWAAQSVSDYCDGLGPYDLLSQLWQHIERVAGFDIVRLKNVRPDATVQGILRMVAEPSNAEYCYQVAKQWADGVTWYRSLNKKKHNNHSRGTRMLKEMGAELRHVDSPSEAMIARLVELKLAWIRAKQLSPSYDIEMLPVLVKALQKLNVLRVFVIERNDEVLAGSINVIQDDKMLAFVATYDPVVAKASPGIILMTHYTQWAFDHGFTLIDYLRGDEIYKFEFANSQVRLDSFTAGKTMLGHTTLTAYHLLKKRSNDTEQPALGTAYLTKAGNVRDGRPKSARDVEVAGTDA